MHIDASEVHALTINLSNAPRRLRDNLDEVFKNEADALQRDMKRAAMGHRYLPAFARQMTAQKVESLHHIIGFNSRGQGSMGHIIVDPTGGARNAPVYDFWEPLRRRTPFFVEHIARIAEDSVFSGPAVLP